MNITLPETIDDGRLDTLLFIFKKARCNFRSTPLELNWKKTQEISPAGYAILNCLFDTLVEQRTNLRCSHIKKNLAELPIIKDLSSLRKPSDPAPISQRHYESEDLLFQSYIGGLNLQFTEDVEAKFSQRLDEEILFATKLILNELMQNSIDHSTSERYYLYAGFWSQEFHVGVLDMGVSIPAKLAQIYDCESDVASLELALKKGISTRRQRLGGFGLYYIFDLLKKQEGKLTILSRGAQLRRYFKTRRVQKGKLKHLLAGTWCFARFSLNLEKTK